MRCWRYDIRQTLAELNAISETLWRRVSQNSGDKLRISFNDTTREFIICRDGHPTPFGTAKKRRGVEKILRRHYYTDVLFHGTD